MAKCCHYEQMDQSTLGLQEDWSRFSNVSRAYSNSASPLITSSSNLQSQPPPNRSLPGSNHFKAPAIAIPSAGTVSGNCAWGSTIETVLGVNPQALVQDATGPERANWDYSQLSALASCPPPLTSSSSTPASSPQSTLLPATPQGVTPELSLPGFSASPTTSDSPDWGHVAESLPATVAQSEQQIASELADLVNRWSVEQQLRAALQAAGENTQARSLQGVSSFGTPSNTQPLHQVSFGPSFQQSNQGQDMFAQIVTCLQQRQAPRQTGLGNSASATSLPELSQQHVPQKPIAALARPMSLPAVHSWHDPIGSAFAVLDNGLQNPRPSRTRSEPLDASLTSSVSTLAEDVSLSPCDVLEGGLLLSYERPLNKTERLKMLIKQDLARFFDMPISEACRQLGVGLTVLKKRCRELGVRRWPHRKLKSMKELIATVQQLSKKDNGQAQRQIGNAIQRLEAERCNIEAVPTLTLTKETRKFRQACFKAKYKMRSLTSCPKP